MSTIASSERRRVRRGAQLAVAIRRSQATTSALSNTDGGDGVLRVPEKMGQNYRLHQRRQLVNVAAAPPPPRHLAGDRSSLNLFC